ncbi:hypothetical protein GQR58_017032 [Nymphon striatum]|nr:hypothetical protein GQR58_017032 [Nymphon striatum]
MLTSSNEGYSSPSPSRSPSRIILNHMYKSCSDDCKASVTHLGFLLPSLIEPYPIKTFQKSDQDSVIRVYEEIGENFNEEPPSERLTFCNCKQARILCYAHYIHLIFMLMSSEHS